MLVALVGPGGVGTARHGSFFFFNFVFCFLFSVSCFLLFYFILTPPYPNCPFPLLLPPGDCSLLIVLSWREKVPCLLFPVHEICVADLKR